MKRWGWLVLFITVVLSLLGGRSTEAEPTQPRLPEPMTWTVDGVRREALVLAPSGTNLAPVIFAFHGHGGTARNAARTFRLQALWPEAVVVYMQGLSTPGITDPEGKKPGWQKSKGDQGDRDLKFFDTVFETVKKKYTINEKQVFVMGHSNGGGFTYLLWAERGDRFAALAPSSAPGRDVARSTPKPVFHLAGEKDPIAPFAAQQRTMAAVRTTNGCASTGTLWGRYCTLYPSTKNAPVVTCIHPNGHEFPAAAPALMVRFFKEVATGTVGKTVTP